MHTIGEKLLEARQRQGIRTQDAAEATHVRREYLEALESNQFDLIPLADVYKRGFLKIYARFLRLDPVRLLDEYAGSSQNRENTGNRRLQLESLPGGSGGDKSIASLDAGELPGAEYTPSVIEPGLRPAAPGRKWGWGATLLLLASVALASGGAWLYLKEPKSGKANSGITARPAEPRPYQATIYSIDGTTEPVPVTIWQTRTQNGVEERDKKILSESILPGRKRTISAQGTLWIESKKLSSIRVQIAGKSFASSPNAESTLIKESQIFPTAP
ncbi:MAG: helix-turn-helix domain-containing protein [Opitutaceae bacterium]|jgi:transcriptional regulator with XRE-family HTH domain|nr:helix-turn-helix domain-containing protein [Opitutaceae bacterium]